MAANKSALCPMPAFDLVLFQFLVQVTSSIRISTLVIQQERTSLVLFRR